MLRNCFLRRLGEPERFACSTSLPAQRRAPRSLVLLYALESLFKLRDQRSFAGLETVASHDAPKITATRPRVRIVYGHQIFGRPACHEDYNVGFGGPVHNHQFVPLLNGVLHRADRVPIVGKQVLIELISVIGGTDP